MTFFDAQLARYKILKIEPVGPLVGATVHGVDLANVSDEALRAELRRALADFQVLFFRNQTLTPEQQLALARVYGDPDKAKAFFPRLAGQSAVEIVETRPMCRATAPINGTPTLPSAIIPRRARRFMRKEFRQSAATPPGRARRPPMTCSRPP